MPLQLVPLAITDWQQLRSRTIVEVKEADGYVALHAAGQNVMVFCSADAECDGGEILNEWQIDDLDESTKEDLGLVYKEVEHTT